MSKIEAPFNIDEDDIFRFSLIIESRSVEAHSLMDSGDNKINLKDMLNSIVKDNIRRDDIISDMIREWKEKHK